MICSPPIYTLDIFTMDESKEGVTESEEGSMSGSTVKARKVCQSLREDQHVTVLLTTTEREARK